MVDPGATLAVRNDADYRAPDDARWQGGPVLEQAVRVVHRVGPGLRHERDGWGEQCY